MLGPAALALITGAAGIACLYLSWRGLFAGAGWLTPAGWLLLIVSAACWIAAGGVEFGIAYALLSIPLLAWVAVMVNAELRRRKPRGPAEATPRPPGHTRLQHLLLSVFAVPVAAVCATLVSVALSQLLPWSRVDEMVLAALMMPLLWGCAAWWICASRRLRRPAAWVVAAGLLSAALLYI